MELVLRATHYCHYHFIAIMRLTVSLSAALLGFVSLVAASNVIDLDTSNFDKYVGGSKGALVELYVHNSVIPALS